MARRSAIQRVACAQALSSKHGFKNLDAICFCYDGWAVFKLAGKGTFIRSTYCNWLILERKKWTADPMQARTSSTAFPLFALPSLDTKEEVSNIAVPVQILAPEHDPQLYTRIESALQ